MPSAHGVFQLDLANQVRTSVFCLRDIGCVSFAASDLRNHKSSCGYKNTLDRCGGFVLPCRYARELGDEFIL